MAAHAEDAAGRAGRELAARLNKDCRVGDLLKLDYNEALIVIHDYFRRRVGGVPLGSFLVATRIIPGSQPNPKEEDTSLVLMRVLGPNALPNTLDTDRDRFEAAKRSTTQAELQWDDEKSTDRFTLNLLRYSGLRCRILGTFLLKESQNGEWGLRFGADLANFYSGQGMKVYKPDAGLLDFIVNFVRPRQDRLKIGDARIRIGRVRYAASERDGDATQNSSVSMDPTDLLARRTALFGMSRTGKSNTTKIVAAAVFRLRSQGIRVGQLIFDPNGEYANDNVQDGGSLKAVGEPSQASGALAGDVVTYGLHPHPNDPGRRIVKLNFFGNEPRDWSNRDAVEEALVGMIRGKDILDMVLSDQTAQYVAQFRALRLDVPNEWDRSAQVRYRRVVCAYRAVLSAHLTPPAGIAQATLSGLTNDELRNALASSSDYASVAQTFGQTRVHWNTALGAWQGLSAAIRSDPSPYVQFNRNYASSRDGRDWHDASLMSVLDYVTKPGGMRLISRLAEYHQPSSTSDYADDVVADLREGRLVIVDQSTGDPVMNKAASDRLMRHVFNMQRSDFINPKRDPHGQLIPPPDVLVYVEEAHNLLPAKNDDPTLIWSRIAKEGSKFRIGLAYATQEPSSIQANILKNTDNWFIAHLNNADELRELKKYYDFDDFAQQILAVPEPGFLRMRTLSNPYTVPVQIDPFKVGGT